MNLDKYKFEVMLIVIVVVLLIFWLLINYFDKKSNKQVVPMNSPSMLAKNASLYNIEQFKNNESTVPSPHNTAATSEKNITKDKDYLSALADKLKNKNKNANNETNASDVENKNELEKNMTVAVQNSKLDKTNEDVASFYSLNMDQLDNLKSQTRKFGVLGLVFFDEKTDTLRIESTKSYDIKIFLFILIYFNLFSPMNSISLFFCRTYTTSTTSICTWTTIR